MIAAGGGNDSVAYYGNESSIDGGTGTNTLVLKAAGTVNLGNADQTSGDSANVTNFQNVDASALSSAVSLTGSSAANTITGGSGNDTIDGAGGADVIAAGARQRYRHLSRHRNLDRRRRRHRYAGAGGLRRHHGDQFRRSRPAPTRPPATASASPISRTSTPRALSSALTVTGSSSANTITTGSGNDIIDGGGGADVIAAGAGNDTVTYRGTETSIDGGTGTNTLVMVTAATVNLAMRDQTAGDSTAVSQLPERRRLGAVVGAVDHGLGGRQHDHRRCRQRHHRRRRRRRRHQRRRRQRQVAYRGTETSIDGGTGTNTLVLKAAATVNLGNADQTAGDSTAVTNFQNVDASALSTGGVADRFVGREYDHRRLGQRHDRRRRRRRHDRGRRRQRHRHLSRHGNLDRRRRRHRYAGPRRDRRHHRGQLLGRGRLGPDHGRQRHVTNFENLDASIAERRR